LTAKVAGSYADTALRIGVTGDLLKGVSFGVTGYAVSTLGLENNLVSNTWTGAHGVTADNGSSFAELLEVLKLMMQCMDW
jgi:imipenem/basic amino acid-specific outer membrane pore